MKHFLRFRGCYCPKRIQPIYLILATFFLLTGVGGKGAFGQSRLSGKVTDTLGNAIERATVHVKSTNTKTATDARGFFELFAATDAVLIVTAMGYQRQEVPVMGQGSVAIILQPAANELEEVEINAGYYTTTRRTSTGNISRVTAKEIDRQPVTNVLGALIGRMPGVAVQQWSGVPGGGFAVEIRGRNSLRSTANAPLYIVNGVPFPSESLLSTSISGQVIAGGSPLVALSPADIQRIEVLKDADATAIYGSRGANGVILITTKKGAAGSTDVNLHVSSGVGKVASMIRLLNSRQYIEMRREAFANDGIAPSVANAPDLELWDTGQYTDWQRVLIGGTARQSNFRGSISGGNENTQFAVRGSYAGETTVFPANPGYKRGSANLHIGHASENRKLRIDASAAITGDRNDLMASDLTRQARLVLPPNAPKLYDDRGNLNWQEGSWDNPFAILEQRYRNGTRNLNASAMIGYEIVTNLILKSNAGINFLQRSEQLTRPKRSYDPASGTLSSATFGKGSEYSWIVEPQLTYRSAVGAGHIDMLVGMTFQESIREHQQVSASGFITDALIESVNAASTRTVTETHAQYRYNAVFGRIHYNLKDRYLINLTGRRDGSSRFGPETRFGNFGAIGAGWVFTGEPFVSGVIPSLDFGKVKASYGITGSDQIGDNEYMETHRSLGGLLQYQGPGVVPSRLANPEFAWEANRKLEVGMELGWWRDRLRISGSWYRNRSSNQLVGLSLAGTTGFPTIQYNLPATVQNRGWELEVSATLVKTGKFSWASDLNITMPSNVLLSYPNIEASAHRFTFMVGQPLGIVRAVQAAGIDDQTGLYRFRDATANILSSNSLAPSASRFIPVFHGQRAFGGMNNILSYGRLQLDLFLQWASQSGPHIFSYFGAPGQQGNFPEAVMERWRQIGDAATTQRFGTGLAAIVGNANRNASDANRMNTSFLRCSNIAVSFAFPERWNSALSIRSARVNLSGQNVFTWSRVGKEYGMDPTSTPVNLPPLRMVVAGIDLTF